MANNENLKDKTWQEKNAILDELLTDEKKRNIFYEYNREQIDKMVDIPDGFQDFANWELTKEMWDEWMDDHEARLDKAEAELKNLESVLQRYANEISKITKNKDNPEVYYNTTYLSKVIGRWIAARGAVLAKEAELKTFEDQIYYLSGWWPEHNFQNLQRK